MLGAAGGVLCITVLAADSACGQNYVVWSRLPKVYGDATLPKHGRDKAYNENRTGIDLCSESLLSRRGNLQQRLTASLFMCSAYIYIINLPQHLEMHKESYTPPTDQPYQKYGPLLPPFLFTRDIEIRNVFYNVMSCLMSFVYRILNGFAGATLSF